jgi:DNA repair protein RadC
MPCSRNTVRLLKRWAAQPALGIAVHDHVIIGKHGHASFKDLRLM